MGQQVTQHENGEPHIQIREAIDDYCTPMKHQKKLKTKGIHEKLESSR
jgi:hypothetical protein